LIDRNRVKKLAEKAPFKPNFRLTKRSPIIQVGDAYEGVKVAFEAIQAKSLESPDPEDVARFEEAVRKFNGALRRIKRVTKLSLRRPRQSQGKFTRRIKFVEEMADYEEKIRKMAEILRTRSEL
jgi:hypothetical protein